MEFIALRDILNIEEGFIITEVARERAVNGDSIIKIEDSQYRIPTRVLCDSNFFKPLDEVKE